MQFDLVSDVHIDFWINNGYTVRRFIDAILPFRRSHILVIAGDLGHINDQNIEFIISLRSFYDHIILVFGNHDLQFDSTDLARKYGFESQNRIYEMHDRLSLYSDVHVLDGTIIELQGVTFGGASMWYDFSYGLQVLGLPISDIWSRWESTNDGLKVAGSLRNVMDFHAHEYQKLRKVISSSDILITHVAPDWSYNSTNFARDIMRSYIYFDSSEFHTLIKSKLWCFGHTHERMSYSAHGCSFINAAVGKPYTVLDTPKKIVNVTF